MAESDILNGGLDWRVVLVGGARVNVDLQEVLEGKRFVRLRRNAKPRLWPRVSIRVGSPQHAIPIFPAICAPTESLRTAERDSRFSIPTMPAKSSSQRTM